MSVAKQMLTIDHWYSGLVVVVTAATMYKKKRLINIK